jgi:hypothetical protein
MRTCKFKGTKATYDGYIPGIGRYGWSKVTVGGSIRRKDVTALTDDSEELAFYPTLLGKLLGVQKRDEILIFNPRNLSLLSSS